MIKPMWVITDRSRQYMLEIFDKLSPEDQEVIRKIAADFEKMMLKGAPADDR